MTERESLALAACRAIADVAIALHKLGDEPTYYSAVLNCPATTEQFCLPQPREAVAVVTKHLRGVARDIPAIAAPVGEIINSLPKA